LYEQYNEKLLIAIAFDANNRIFSLAFAIVEKIILIGIVFALFTETRYW
jgi:hypothetical protein